ncbi:MAG: hypothetical protein LUE20_02400 [Oscillospiraceae bacterium]|nr:hypothetical protein [Oscillospiraceae bacterium]
MREGSITTGKVYYDTGELYFEGTYYNDYWCQKERWRPVDLIKGTAYFKNGNKYREGYFQRGGLLVGREYYESGILRFDGIFNDKGGILDVTKDVELIETYQKFKDKYHPIRYTDSYYGPIFPLCGRFYSEKGELLLDGNFRVRLQGGVGYPKVISPKEYGKLG